MASPPLRSPRRRSRRKPHHPIPACRSRRIDGSQAMLLLASVLQLLKAAFELLRDVR